MKPRYFFAALALLLAPAAGADELKPFTSDGCSAFPDGTLDQQALWLQCCTAHDRAYWKGGTYQQRMDADLELRNCVAQVDQPEIAAIMLIGVRVGGSPAFPTRFRWGYGWEWPRWYGPLTEEELLLVDAAAQVER
ncbi:MAG: hypothetical protein ACTS5G_02275 [Burkholderiales bacterium]